MELLLNFLWLAVVGAVSTALIRQEMRRSHYRRNLLMLLCSLVCISILLFPAISVSDDLSVQWMPTESPAKLMSQLLCASENGELLTFTAALLLALMLLAMRLGVGVARDQECFSPLGGVLSVICGRAPPQVA